MGIYRTASAYAKSLITLARDNRALDKVYEDMQLIVKTCESSREFQKFLTSPVIGSLKKLEIIEQVFKGKVSNFTLMFFTLITKKNRENLLLYIAKEWIEEYKVINNIQTATLYTAFEADDKLKKQIGGLLSTISDKKMSLNIKIDPSIIGGFILNTGDKQIDASVKSKLNKIKNQFSTNSYISKL